MSKRAGVYAYRTRKPHAPIGLPLIGRHWGYVGQTNSFYHRHAQHTRGGGTYNAIPKDWATLEPKRYILPCLFPHWRRARLMQEQLWIWLLWPVYNVQGNRWNPRRITPAAARRQREARIRTGSDFNLGRWLFRLALYAVLAGAAIAYLIK